MKKILILILLSLSSFSQNVSLNNDFIYNDLRSKIILGKVDNFSSLTIRPISFSEIINSNYNNINSLYKTVLEKKNIELKLLPINYIIDFNSHHPYNRNNGSLIPNRGYQHLISTGIFLKVGPLSMKINPEHHYSQNKKFDGFWEGHYSKIWAERYKLWNHSDIPERFGEKRHNQKLIGQSNIKFSFGKISLGISNENLWWGPSIRNSIMMSNHAEGFKHITFNTNSPIETFFGNIEWQIITGRLEASGYTPPRTDMEHAGTKLYVRKQTQNTVYDDWRYLQAYIITISPIFIKNFSFGVIRWVQMYSQLLEGKYWWLKGKPTYFPAFKNIFRKNDRYENYEEQTDQAGGVFFRWLWDNSNAEIYAEYYYNDAKQNLRDLLVDSDHSRAVTVGLQKGFVSKNNLNFLFSWEWTQMEQTASRLTRNAGSWYEHRYIYHGYTNRGEVLGSGIGPGSNSHYLSLKLVKDYQNYGLGFEIIDQDNDFYHQAFASARDFRRLWKDFNFNFFADRKLNNFWISMNLLYSRSLNYQWELEDNIEPYYHPGRDVNNFHFNLKVTYSLN